MKKANVTTYPSLKPVKHHADTETALTHEDWRRLQDIEYFLEALIRAMDAGGENTITCFNVGSILRPALAGLSGVVGDLEQAEWAAKGTFEWALMQEGGPA